MFWNDPRKETAPMDEQAQRQAIVDKLVGVPPETLPLPSALTEPWRTIYEQARRAGDSTEAEILLGEITRHLPGGEGLARRLVEMLPPGDAFTAYPSLHEISGRFPSVDWLWPSWIPRGMLTLFGAAPGAGKSLVALDLARRVIHGEPFPDGAPSPDGARSRDRGGNACPGARVLMVDAEGAPALLKQRAQAWGIDSRRLFLMLASNTVGLIDLSNFAQQKLLWKMCCDLEPALVVVDSLGAATAQGETSLEAARATMNYLTAVARLGNLALLLIHHLRKQPSSRRATATRRVAADDLRGSSHIIAAARSVMVLSVVGERPPEGGRPPIAGAPDKAQPVPGEPLSHFDSPRRLEIVKSNLCRHPPPLGLIFEGEDLAVPTLRYTEYVEPTPQPTRTDLCAGWLFHFLETAGEPVKPADAVRAAGKAGYHRRMVYRARKLLGGLVVDLGSGMHDPQKRWTVGSRE
jgi:hypothetical protein